MFHVLIYHYSYYHCRFHHQNLWLSIFLCYHYSKRDDDNHYHCNYYDHYYYFNNYHNHYYHSFEMESPPFLNFLYNVKKNNGACFLRDWNICDGLFSAPFTLWVQWYNVAEGITGHTAKSIWWIMLCSRHLVTPDDNHPHHYQNHNHNQFQLSLAYYRYRHHYYRHCHHCHHYCHYCLYQND